MSSRFGRGTASSTPRLLVLFDGDCGFCSWSVALIGRLDHAGRLELAPVQDASAHPADAPPVGSLLGAIHVRDVAGRWTTGGAACVRIASEVPLLRPFARAASVRPLSRLVEPAYALISRNRQRLSRLVGATACTVRDEQR